jgi:hypothetical protein
MSGIHHHAIIFIGGVGLGAALGFYACYAMFIRARAIVEKDRTP